jgi:hypothetical protein
VALERLEQASRNLNSHPEPTESNRWAYETYQRGLVAENMLIDALKDRAITANNGRNTPIDNLFWKGHPHFGYYIELSIVRMPRSSGLRRFEPARIEEQELDSWLLTLVPLTESAKKPLSLEDQCRLFLRKQVAAGPQKKSKEAYFLEAGGEIPGLIRAGFDRAWKIEARAWTRGGRRPWPKESP